MRRTPCAPTAATNGTARSTALRCMAAMKACVQSLERSATSRWITEVPARTHSVRVDQFFHSPAVCIRAGRALWGEAAEKWRGGGGGFLKPGFALGDRWGRCKRGQQLLGGGGMGVEGARDIGAHATVADGG